MTMTMRLRARGLGCLLLAAAALRLLAGPPPAAHAQVRNSDFHDASMLWQRRRAQLGGASRQRPVHN